MPGSSLESRRSSLETLRSLIFSVFLGAEEICKITGLINYSIACTDLSQAVPTLLTPVSCSSSDKCNVKGLLIVSCKTFPLAIPIKLVCFLVC